MIENPRFSRVLVNLCIALFWIYLIVDSYIQGRGLPALLGEVELPDLPLALFVSAALAISIIASALTFWQRKNLMDEMPLVAGKVDRWFGVGSYSRFTHQLRPVWASILSSTVLGVVGVYTTYHLNQHAWSYAISGGTLVFALFMFAAWLLSRRYPPILS